MVFLPESKEKDEKTPKKFFPDSISFEIHLSNFRNFCFKALNLEEVVVHQGNWPCESKRCKRSWEALVKRSNNIYTYIISNQYTHFFKQPLLVNPLRIFKTWQAWLFQVFVLFPIMPPGVRRTSRKNGMLWKSMNRKKWSSLQCLTSQKTSFRKTTTSDFMFVASILFKNK